MTVLAFKFFCTFLVISWCMNQADGATGKWATVVAFIGIAAALGVLVSGFAWVMLFIWLPW